MVGEKRDKNSPLQERDQADGLSLPNVSALAGVAPIRGRTWAQTELAAHEAWAALTLRAPKAAALLHALCRIAGSEEAVAASQRVLADFLGTSQATIARALVVLEKEGWIQILRMGATGQVAAYRINSRAHWSGERGTPKHMSSFRARLLVAYADQPEAFEHKEPLRQIPSLRGGEAPLPLGPGLDPPSQQLLGGIDPPSIATGDDME